MLEVLQILIMVIVGYIILAIVFTKMYYKLVLDNNFKSSITLLGDDAKEVAAVLGLLWIISIPIIVMMKVSLSLREFVKSFI